MIAVQRKGFTLAGLLSKVDIQNLAKPHLNTTNCDIYSPVPSFGTSTRTREEFSESIKKGSISNATPLILKLCNKKCFGHSSGESVFNLRRWRRLISPFAAVTKKPAVLSPSSLRRSISSMTSWGIRTVVICDFAFFAPVAIAETPCVKCISVYAKKRRTKDLRCISLWANLKPNGDIHLLSAKPGSASTLTGPLTTTDSLHIEAAMKNHTTHPQGRNAYTLNSGAEHTSFIWLIAAVRRDTPTIAAKIHHIAAESEQEARRTLAQDHICFFAGRIRLKEAAA